MFVEKFLPQVLKMYSLSMVTAQKMKFSVEDFFPQFSANLVTFTKEILYGELHFLRSSSSNR